MPDKLIQLADVRVSYPGDDGGRKVVLNGVNLNVSLGEFVTLVGPSGCGKSTLLRLLLGSQFPDDGTVMFGGEPIAGFSRDRGIVYQTYSLYPGKTVVDNVAFGPMLEQTSIPDAIFRLPGYRRKRREARREAMEFIERVGLDPADAEKYPYELSGGMRQRVAIAQALIMKPRLVLMDEPFGALDHNTREEMQLFILEMWEKFGMTVFFVTHDLEEACYLGTRIIGLSQYWSDGDGTEEGAKIVTDRGIPGEHPKSTEVKRTQEFQSLLGRVRRDVLAPEHRQHLSAFDRSHPDAFPVVVNGNGGA